MIYTMKKALLILSAIIYIAVPSFSFNISPAALWSGLSLNSLGGGIDFGIDIKVDLSYIPSFIVEAENSSNMSRLFPPVFPVSMTRIGLVWKYEISDSCKIRFSTGGGGLYANQDIDWYDGSFNSTNSLVYYSLGVELKLLGTPTMLKTVVIPGHYSNIVEADLSVMFDLNI